MFPTLPTLPALTPLVASRPTTQAIINVGGGAPDPGGVIGGGSIGGGGPCLFNCGSGGSTVPISSIFPGLGTAASAAGSALSSVLGIPSINWGRIAAFILGLILIAGGLFLIKPVQSIVVNTVKNTAKSGAKVAEVAAA